MKKEAGAWHHALPMHSEFENGWQSSTHRTLSRSDSLQPSLLPSVWLPSGQAGHSWPPLQEESGSPLQTCWHQSHQEKVTWFRKHSTTFETTKLGPLGFQAPWWSDSDAMEVREDSGQGSYLPGHISSHVYEFLSGEPGAGADRAVSKKLHKDANIAILSPSRDWDFRGVWQGGRDLFQGVGEKFLGGM